MEHAAQHFSTASSGANKLDGASRQPSTASRLQDVAQEPESGIRLFSDPAHDSTESVGVAASTIQVGMQGIFTTGKRESYGYELLFRAPGMNYADLRSEADHERATAQVITATFADFGVVELAEDKLLFLNTTRGFFTGHLPLPFGPKAVVLEILESIDIDDEVLQGLYGLQKRGYLLAVDDFDGDPRRIEAVRCANYVKIDIEAVGESLADIVRLVRTSNPQARIIAERVETEEHLKTCSHLGIDLIQGYLLGRPRTRQARTLPANTPGCIQLLAALSDPATPTNTLVDLVKSDPSLAVRILRAVGSAAYAPGEGITSLRQAVVLLGREELTAWITLIMLGGSDTVTSQEQVKPHLQAQSTRILSRAIACKLQAAYDPHAAYTVGLLSGVAEVLGCEVQDILAGCAIAPRIREALVEESGALGAVLRTTVANERAFAGRLTTEGGPTAGTIEAPAPAGEKLATPVHEVSLVHLRALVSARRSLHKALS